MVGYFPSGAQVRNDHNAAPALPAVLVGVPPAAPAATTGVRAGIGAIGAPRASIPATSGATDGMSIGGAMRATSAAPGVVDLGPADA